MHQRKTVQPQRTARGPFGGYYDLDAYDKHIEDLRNKQSARVSKEQERQETPKREPWTGDDIRLSRDEARPGEVCNPWQSRSHYLPLLPEIAARTDLSTGDKVLHAAVVRRFAMNLVRRNGLPVEKLAEETGMSVQMVRRRLRRLTRHDLIYRKFGLLGIEEYDKPVSAIPRVLVPLVADRRLSAVSLVVYGRLTGLSGEKGYWFDTNETLMEECGCSIKPLRSAIHELEQQKLLRVRRQAKRGRLKGGGWNVYEFLGHAIFLREMAKRQK